MQKKTKLKVYIAMVHVHLMFRSYVANVQLIEVRRL